MLPKPSCSVAIIADDLTSAADGAGPFVARGLSARVGRRVLPAGAEVRAVDTGSRSASEAEAAARVARDVAALRDANILFKTVDSTLRGHVRAELEAAIGAAGRGRLVLAPAFPEAGRTTVDGVQLVGGTPVDQSSYGRDPVHPARVSRLAEILPQNAGDALVLDARTQAELDAQVARIPAPEGVLWAGAPGLAQALARRLRPEPRKVREIVSNTGVSGLPLVVVGSANAVSHRQAAEVGARAVVLRAPVDRGDSPRRILADLATTAAAHIASGGIGAVIATGGDTLDAVLARLGVAEFTLLGELDPGVPLGGALTARGPMLLAMKAGGFGDDGLLRRLVERLSPGDGERTQ